jgi:hypothetical protein
MRYNRWILTLLIVAMIVLALPVYASVAGRRNTAIAATAFSLYQLARGRTTTGILSGAGAYYAWNQYNKARKSRRSRSEREAFLRGYQEGVRRSYRSWRSAGHLRR